jgi:hemoglobin/transferrin/lactoferrin receptor protein
MRPNPLCRALSLCLCCPVAAFAADALDESAEAAPADTLDRVVVIGTLSAQAIADVPATIDAIDRDTMDARLVHDLKDLFRYEPGISVPAGDGRFGLGDIRIRGLGGNRVLIQTDGIPVSDGFSIGSFSNANRNFVDLDTLKQVEILRGPGSALYGSDALGGVVSFRTKDPEDYLRDGRDRHFALKLGYEGDWDGLFGGATFAAGGERWSGLIAAGHRQGGSRENQGKNDVDGALRSAPDPQQRDGRSLLAKLVFAPDGTQRWRLTAEGSEDAADTDVRSALSLSPLTGATVLALVGDDRRRRVRFALEHELDATAWRWADTLRWSIYRQHSRTVQDTDELRRSASGALQRRQRGFAFEQRLAGIEALASKTLRTGAVEHALTWGAELTRTRTEQKRDGVATNPATGASTPTIPPDTFPVRDFPISRTTTAALFVQDEIGWGGGEDGPRLRLIPALRIDHYRLQPQSDPIFAGDNPGVAVMDLTETHVAPKLGLVWRFAADWSLFAGYARGFRAPPYGDVNIGFTNLAFGYTAIANPDLKPETSDGLEAGLRYGGEAAWFSLALYENRYRDFIESLRFVGIDAGGLQVFQSRNVADARIRGTELKAGVDFGRLSPSFAGWSLRGAAAWAHGQDRTAGRPLDSVDPLRGSLGLAYARDAWGVELAGVFAARQRLTSSGTLYRPSGYGVWDLLAHWRFAPGARLNLGVFNLGDRRYTDWADVPGVAATSPVLDRYTRPGRSVSASLAFEW